jgi:hypothetical protein
MQGSTKVLPSSLSSLVPKQSLRPRGITSLEKTARDYKLRSQDPAVRGFSTLNSTGTSAVLDRLRIAQEVPGEFI